jgi:hypothetical protein
MFDDQSWWGFISFFHTKIAGSALLSTVNLLGVKTQDSIFDKTTTAIDFQHVCTTTITRRIPLPISNLNLFANKLHISS